MQLDADRAESTEPRVGILRGIAECRWIFAALLALPLLLAEVGRVAGVPLGTGTHAGGTEIECVEAGVAFRVPAGFQGGYDSEAKAALFRSADGAALLGVYAFSEASRDEMARVSEQLIREQGIELMPESVETPNETEMRARFRAVTEHGAGVLLGVVRAGEHGNAVTVATLCSPDRESEMQSVLDAVLASLRWSRPEASRWRERLTGRSLRAGGSSSEYSPGGAGGGGSYASGSDTVFDFCSDGSYAFQTRTESYMSIEGASAERVHEDAHQGQWWLVADIGGAATLVLEATDGRVFYWAIEETQSGARVDGSDYTVTASDRCR